MLSNLRVMLSLVSAVITLILTLFFDGILANHLIAIGIDESLVGYLFGSIALVYAFSSPIVSILARKMPTRYITQASYIISFVALILLGPSKFFHFPYNSVPMTIAGLGILGFTTATVFVPLLSEIIDAIEEKENCRGNAIINDKASALFNTAGAIGTIIGPIIGGIMDDKFGFQTTCDILAGSSLVFGALFFFLGILPACLKKRSSKLDDGVPDLQIMDRSITPN